MFEPADEEYRTCGERGADCEPEPFDAGEGQGVRIALACPTHGVHSVVDLFEGKRQLVVLQQRRRPQRMRGGSTSKNGLEVARKRGKDGGRPRMIDDDKRTVILARRERGQSIREIGATTGVSLGAVLGVVSGEKAGASSSQGTRRPIASRARPVEDHRLGRLGEQLLLIRLRDRLFEPFDLGVQLALVAWTNVSLDDERDPRAEWLNGLCSTLHHAEDLVPGTFNLGEHARRPIGQTGVADDLHCGSDSIVDWSIFAASSGRGNGECKQHGGSFLRFLRAG